MVRIKPAGDSALLLELDPVIDPEVNARAIAAAETLRERRLPGVRDVVSTYRSVAVYFDPLVLDLAVLHQEVERASHAAPRAGGTGRTVEVPVAYGGDDGPDLAEVAAFAGLTSEQAIARHAGTEYRVYMLGFLPGFAYMGSVPREIAAPRRAAPRLRVPAGSVGIAGLQTAIYPRQSPGGWQIIGRTDLQVFDLGRVPPALFAPGDSVRFRPIAGARLKAPPPAADGGHPAAGLGRTGRSLTVLRPGLLTTIQDSGRWGHQSFGVPVSGPMDPVAHRLANALVGNPRDAATLEATVSGPELRLDADTTIAVAGADMPATLGGSTIAPNAAVRGRRGDVLRLGARRTGGRTYLAVDGGIAVPAVLGSRATHALTALGGVSGRALAAGDCLPLGHAGGTPARRRIGGSIVSGGARVRVLRGPQDEFFPDDAFDRLQRQRFTVTTQSDRMGYRLHGARIPRVDGREMISDATFAGALQVPASGQPILLMADRQTTGGYPQIATVITADLPLAAQLVPGDWIEFEFCSRADAIAALVAQEGKLLAVG